MRNAPWMLLIVIALSSQLASAAGPVPAPGRRPAEAAPSGAPAAPAGAPAATTTSTSRLHLLGFRAGYYLQMQSVGLSYSWALSWNPHFQLKEKIAVVGNIGVSMLNSSLGLVTIAEYGVRGSYDLPLNLIGELGVGGKTFIRTGSSAANTTALTVDAGVGYRFGHKILKLLDRIQLGYSYILISGAPTHQVRASVGVSI